MAVQQVDLDIPIGAPCWMDLLSSDPDKSIAFYAGLFGWDIQDTPPEMQGYRYFTKDQKAVGGCMQNLPEWQAPDSWSIHLRTDDADAIAAAAPEHGGRVAMAPMTVGENGRFAVIIDAGGASISAWQPGTESGFGMLMADGAPVHFELHTRDFDKTVQFYQDVFGWTPQLLADTPDFRYATHSDASFPRAGIMDATAFLPDGATPSWSVYLGTGDVDATIARAVELGGSVVHAAEDTPYGRLATLSDTTKAVFKLRG